MVLQVEIPQQAGPIARRQTVRAYGRTLDAMLDAAGRYAASLREEVGAARSDGSGRALIVLGHVLGWGGLALALFGLFRLKQASLDHLIFGPFAIGLLMQIPSGALVRAGRRRIARSNAGEAEPDRRRPVVLLREFRDAAVDGLERTIAPRLSQYGPLIDLAAPGMLESTFGSTNPFAIAARRMDDAMVLVILTEASSAYSGDPHREIEAIVRRRHGHKLMVVMAPSPEPAQRWADVRDALQAVPGFERLPEQAPAGLLAVHLSASGEPVLITGPLAPAPADYAQAIDIAVYGMKCHGRW